MWDKGRVILCHSGSIVVMMVMLTMKMKKMMKKKMMKPEDHPGDRRDRRCHKVKAAWIEGGEYRVGYEVQQGREEDV